MDVKTAGRTVDLFEIFAKTQSPMTLSEIARALNAPQSSCFNLVRALESRGYLYSVGGAKRIYPTRKLFNIVDAIANFEPVVPRVDAILEKLRDETNETIIFGARQGYRAIYLAVMEGTQTIRYISRAGELKPMHASAIGKALLVAMPPADRTKLIRKLPIQKVNEATITTVEQLIDDLTTAEARGYTVTKGENVADVMAVGVPILVDSMSYAVAVAGPIQRMEDRADEYAALMKASFADF